MKKYTIRILVSVLIGTSGIGYYLISPVWYQTTLDEGFPIPPAFVSKQSEMSKKSPNTVVLQSLVATGMFTGAGRHVAEGVALLFSYPDSDSYVRLENFIVTNGPLLYVYVTTVDENGVVKEHEIAPLKASTGSHNYILPTNLNVQLINKVYIYCKPFRTVFGKAEFKR
jgi:hypothetical protein